MKVILLYCTHSYFNIYRDLIKHIMAIRILAWLQSVAFNRKWVSKPSSGHVNQFNPSTGSLFQRKNTFITAGMHILPEMVINVAVQPPRGLLSTPHNWAKLGRQIKGIPPIPSRPGQHPFYPNYIPIKLSHHIPFISPFSWVYHPTWPWHSPSLTIIVDKLVGWYTIIVGFDYNIL